MIMHGQWLGWNGVIVMISEREFEVTWVKIQEPSESSPLLLFSFIRENLIMYVGV